MMTAMERSISPYEERGSEVKMDDSPESKDAVEESGKSRRSTLGIDVGVSDSDNMKTFKKMTVDTGVFTYEGNHDRGSRVVWDNGPNPLYLQIGSSVFQIF